MGFRSDIMLVSDVVRHLVEKLAGGDVKTDEGKIEKDDVMAWWAKAQQTGEEAYVVT
jgi:hypothetical protein